MGRRRTQSLRGPRSAYGKLQEPSGRCSGGRLRRSLSLRERREKSGSLDRNLDSPDTPTQERLPGALGDTEQLIQAQHRGSRRWLRPCQQVKRRWQDFVANFPGVTLSRPASPEPPLGTSS
ncbi:uncharacterized protein C11orf86 homolog [Suncus etruscus]|uniref:uncharacterized protein C11orf86 homolog n=1 Tax=Suncus etruscus TaxID=109475 RepID=UPI00210FCB6D|nr:uncharacterized protein C11orf86 homolog [Suncus etruscus]